MRHLYNVFCTICEFWPLFLSSQLFSSQLFICFMSCGSPFHTFDLKHVRPLHLVLGFVGTFRSSFVSLLHIFICCSLLYPQTTLSMWFCDFVCSCERPSSADKHLTTEAKHKRCLAGAAWQVRKAQNIWWAYLPGKWEKRKTFDAPSGALPTAQPIGLGLGKVDSNLMKLSKQGAIIRTLLFQFFFSFSNGDIIPFPHIGGVIVAAIYLTFSVLRMWLFYGIWMA